MTAWNLKVLGSSASQSFPHWSLPCCYPRFELHSAKALLTMTSFHVGVLSCLSIYLYLYNMYIYIYVYTTYNIYIYTYLSCLSIFIYVNLYLSMLNYVYLCLSVLIRSFNMFQPGEWRFGSTTCARAQPSGRPLRILLVKAVAQSRSPSQPQKMKPQHFQTNLTKFDQMFTMFLGEM